MLRVAACLAALALVAGCGADAQPGAAPSSPPPAPLRVLVAGDSLSEGYYADDPDTGFAPRFVEELARDRPVDPLLEPVSGARAFRVAAAVEQVGVGLEPVDVAVLEAGSNDIGVSTRREFAAGYTRLIRSVTDVSPDAVVVCLGLWDQPRLTRPYDDVVRRLCATHTFVPISDLFSTPGLRGPAGTPTTLGPRDDFHPNDRGHAAIAQRILAALDDALPD